MVLLPEGPRAERGLLGGSCAVLPPCVWCIHIDDLGSDRSGEVLSDLVKVTVKSNGHPALSYTNEVCCRDTIALVDKLPRPMNVKFPDIPREDDVAASTSVPAQLG